MSTILPTTILEKIAGQRVLVIGDVCLDQYITGAVERLNPEAPVPILEARREREHTGGAGNTAKNIASLGGHAVLVGIVGRDDIAQRIAVAAQAEGYETRLVVDPNRPTIRKVRYLVGSQQLLRVDYEEKHDIVPAIEDELIAVLETVVREGVTGILVSDYAKGAITERVAQAILRVAKEHGVPVAADVKPSRAAFFTGATMISPNVKEGHEYLGFNIHERVRPREELAQLLCERMQTDVYLTLGGEGIFIHTQDGTACHVPQEHVVEVFDVSGAGDTAAAMLLLARLAGASAVEAAHLANAAGAVAVSKIGSMAVTLDEVQTLLHETHNAQSHIS